MTSTSIYNEQKNTHLILIEDGIGITEFIKELYR